MSRWSIYVCLLSAYFFHSLKCQVNPESDNDIPDFEEVSDSTWSVVSENYQHILILFCKNEDADCERVLNFFVDYPSPPGFSGELKIYQSRDLVLGNKLGISEYPAIVYYRENAPVPYDGELDDESFSQWLLQAQEIATKILTDDTFEHLTQAVTGSTTGDWLVLFCKESSPICKQAVIDFETVAVRLLGKTNVAKVDMEENPKLVERFSLIKSPSILFFRQGTMYRYEMDKISVKILMSFVEAWYRNMKAEKIPLEPTAFDKVTEDIALFIKKQLHGPNGKIILAVSGGIASLFFLVLIFCCCCRRSQPKEKTQ